MTKPIKGVALAPGVSRNGRLYTPENISKAYARLNARLNDPAGRPVVMRTHHAAGDDSTRIVAQVTSAKLTSDYRITYEAAPVDTEHGRTILALAEKQANGKPALAHVSIYGWWTADPVKKEHDGRLVETADDLEIDAIDFTASPGVAEASVRTESVHRHAIHESFEAEITMGDVVETAPVSFADPGYRDAVKHFPLTNAGEVCEAWAGIDRAQADYTPAQVRRMRTRTKSAARKLGVRIDEGWLYTPIAEYGIDMADTATEPASFSINATNGPITVNISSYRIDPADLEVIAKAAMQAATDALKAMDPDMDGDIDVPGAEDVDGDTTESVATHSSTDVVENTADTVGTTEQESTVADNAAVTTEGAAAAAAAPVTETAAPAPAVFTIDYKALAEAFLAVSDARDAAKAAAESAPVDETAAVTETAAPVLDKATIQEALLEMIGEGAVKAQRKGFAAVEETTGPSSDELWENRGELFTAVARENR